MSGTSQEAVPCMKREAGAYALRLLSGRSLSAAWSGAGHAGVEGPCASVRAAFCCATCAAQPRLKHQAGRAPMPRGPMLEVNNLEVGARPQHQMRRNGVARSSKT